MHLKPVQASFNCMGWMVKHDFSLFKVPKAFQNKAFYNLSIKPFSKTVIIII